MILTGLMTEWKQERPKWCLHPTCQFSLSIQGVICCGELPKPEPHGDDHNTHRICWFTGNGEVFDLQVNRGDTYHFRKIFDHIHPEKAKMTDLGPLKSIFSDKNLVIPLADVQHVEKKYHTTDLTNGTKKGDLLGALVITKHTRWDFEHDTWANNIWLSAEQVNPFLAAWVVYRDKNDD